jgi:hypothetical protein
MSAATVIRGIGVMRMGFGVLGLAAPGTLARMFGVDPDLQPGVKFPGRLFGVRDLVLGIGTLSGGSSGRAFAVAGVASDAGDAVASMLSRRDHEIPERKAQMAAASAVASALIGGFAVLRRR